MSIYLGIIVASIAAVTSLVTTTLTTRITVRNNQSQLVQTQYREVIQKRIEHYPRLWSICLRYGMYWLQAEKATDREWAVSFLNEINELNLDAGVFFSQALYLQFAKLRSLLLKAVRETDARTAVDEQDVENIIAMLYGQDGPGLGTIVKDDLGSYQSSVIQRRRE